MSQVMKGLLLGSPGPIGSAAIVILYGSGAPDGQDPNIGGARQGSVFIDYTTPALYFKTSASTWTLITIP